MPPYLSPAWVQAFNAALAGLDLTDAIAQAGAGSLTAAQGAFSVAQVVTDAPAMPGASGGIVRTVLNVGDGRIMLMPDPDETLPSNVTIVVAYVDALSIARGELDPADALAAGRVRVRGELAVLVAGQSVLNAASLALGRTLTELTDLTDQGDTANPDG
jgi:SCP-2 sterol transfer family